MGSTGLIILVADTILCAAIVTLLVRGGRKDATGVPRLATLAPPGSLGVENSPPAATVVATSTTKVTTKLAGWRRESGISALSIGPASSSTVTTAIRSRARPVATPIPVPVYVDEPYASSVEEMQGDVLTLAPEPERTLSRCTQTCVAPHGKESGTLPQWFQSPTRDYSFALGQHVEDPRLRRRMLIAAGTGAALAITYAWLR